MLVCTLAVAIGDCGGSAPRLSDTQRVTQALRSYLDAQAAGNGQTACALLTATAQTQLITLVLQAGKGLITTRPSCQNAVALVSQFAGSALMSALKNAQIQQVQVTGTRATAQIVDHAQFKPQKVSLQKPGTAWKIAGVPGLGG